jgi:hypothetical protein
MDVLLVLVAKSLLLGFRQAATRVERRRNLLVVDQLWLG